MNIKDRINKECIDLDLKSTNKDELLKELIELLYKNDIIDNKEEFLKDVYMREIAGPTSIGNGIAIPHGKSKYVKEVSMAIGKIKGSVEWDDINNFTVSFIILFAVPDMETSNEEMKLMSDICIKLADDYICQRLIDSYIKEDVIEILS